MHTSKADLRRPEDGRVRGPHDRRRRLARRVRVDARAVPARRVTVRGPARRSLPVPPSRLPDQGVVPRVLPRRQRRGRARRRGLRVASPGTSCRRSSRSSSSSSARATSTTARWPPSSTTWAWRSDDARRRSGSWTATRTRWPAAMTRSWRSSRRGASTSSCACARRTAWSSSTRARPRRRSARSSPRPTSARCSSATSCHGRRASTTTRSTPRSPAVA